MKGSANGVQVSFRWFSEVFQSCTHHIQSTSSWLPDDFHITCSRPSNGLQGTVRWTPDVPSCPFLSTDFQWSNSRCAQLSFFIHRFSVSFIDFFLVSQLYVDFHRISTMIIDWQRLSLLSIGLLRCWLNLLHFHLRWMGRPPLPCIFCGSVFEDICVLCWKPCAQPPSIRQVRDLSPD